MENRRSSSVATSVTIWQVCWTGKYDETLAELPDEEALQPTVTHGYGNGYLSHGA